MAYRNSKRLQVPFASKLILNQWLLSLFKVSHFEGLAKHLRNDEFEPPRVFRRLISLSQAAMADPSSC